MWINGSYRYVDQYSTTFADSAQSQSDAQEVVDASINYEIGSVQLSLFGRNLTDSNEWQHALDVAGLFSFAAPRAPRTVGLELTYRFGD